MSLSVHMLHFANKIIGTHGSVHLNLNKGKFRAIITGYPITLENIISSLDQIDGAFEEFCLNNNDMSWIWDITYDAEKDEYVCHW